MKNVLAFLTAYKKKTAELAQLTEIVENMKTELTDYINQNGTVNGNQITVVCGQYIAKITMCKRSGIDTKRLKTELPDVAKEYATETEYNRLTVN